MNIKKMNKALDLLRTKYGADKGVIELREGIPYVGSAILLPQRVERRLMELKKMVTGETLEGVSTLRFASFAPKGADMRAMLARELDIASYLGGSDIVQVFAVTGGRLAINVLAKLQNGISVSIEIGVGMPKGSEPFDRHEIIARRGVASDQTVDTHTAHSSIRCWGDKGVQDYTDVDTEIFGLTTEEVWTVRAAFALLQKRASAKIWNAAAKKAFRAADLAFESDKAMAAKKISLKNAVDTTAAVAMSEVR